jgi:hypothetical protein
LIMPVLLKPNGLKTIAIRKFRFRNKKSVKFRFMNS